MAALLVLGAVLGLAGGLARAAALDLVVNDQSDMVDANVGDGVCRTSAGTCTLRAAIQEANAVPGADAIRVPAGTYALTIPPLNQNDITTGDLDVTGSLSVTGAGAGATIVDGGTPAAGAPPQVRGLDRLFEVLVDGGTVTFSGLSFSDGYAAEYGGAIFNNSAATVTVVASTLTGNVAGKTGGAIDNHLGGTVDVRDSTLSGNYASESGSALNNNRDGATAVANSTIASNSAQAVGLDPAQASAGAIANNGELDARGTITVSASRITDNSTGGARSGAAISNDGSGTVVVEQTTLSRNRAEVDGGAIFNGGGDVTVRDSTFSENVGDRGGAIFNSIKDARLTVSGSTFALNTASARGGAIASAGTGHLAITDSTFSKNSADDWGGAVANDDKGSVAIANSTFEENSGLNGGGFGNEGDGRVTVENSRFEKNTAFVTAVLASGEGGGMHTNSVGEVVITGGAFTENEARSGGGFSNEGGGQVEITGTRFFANSAEEKGGGILLRSGAVRMVDIDVIGNAAGSAVEGGGGIAYEGDKLMNVGESAAIESSRIRDNKAKTAGGGIDGRGDGPLAITTTAITGNTAVIGGGIHHVGDAPLEITRSTLSANFAESGGGVFVDGDGEATVENTTISGNRAGQFGGGLLVSSRLTIRSSTVASNSAASGGGINNGGGDLVGDGSVFLANTIVANSPTGGNCTGTMTSRGGNLDSANVCQLRELSDQPGTDPLLGPLADNGGSTQTHALLADSPAQERASCTALDPCPSLDQRGVARPQFDAFDIGAYESELTPGGGGGTQQCAGRTERPVLSDSDSWVSQSAPAANFGSDSILKVRSQSGGNSRALVRFKLPAVPPGCKLVGATLRLYSSSANDGRVLEARRIVSDWTELGVTWADQPATADPVATTQSGIGLREWDVLAQTLDMYELGGHGFQLRDRTENGIGEQSFHGREKGADRPPELVMVFDDPDAPPRPGLCPTTPQSLSANQDSWVNQASPSNNFGTDSTLKVKSQGGANARALIRFPLPLLPAGCTSVASALLRVEASSSNEGRTLAARQVASTWSETGVTWSNQPAATGPAATTPSGQGTLEWDVTAQVLGMYTSANHGLVIRDTVEGGVGEQQTLNSRDKLSDGPPELLLIFDDTTPETTIELGPASRSNEQEATFVFSSDRADATFECSLDGAPFEACSSPHLLRGLTEADHRFDVRATRPVRAVDPTPAHHEWTVALSPRTMITDQPDDPTNSTSATFAFTASENPDEPPRFQCRLDPPSGAWAECASPFTYDGLGAGAHRFEVRAVDAAGYAGAHAGTAWRIDLTAPEAAIGARPPDVTNQRSASFTFAGSDNLDEPLRFECSLDPPAAGWGPCSSPAAYDELGEGMYSFAVRAVDVAGNVGVPAGAAWRIDLTAPETEIGDKPPDPTQKSSATFTFVGSEPGSSFECSLDGAGFGSCSSPVQYAGLAAGLHQFRVRAIDQAGNVDPEPAAHSWTVVPPDCTSAPAVPVADTWVDQSAPTVNKGPDVLLTVRSRTGRRNARALVRFPLPAPPQGCTLESATLRVYSSSASTGRTLRVLRVAASWFENNVTWNTQPATTGAAVSTASGPGYREWSVTSLVQAMYLGSNHGFLIRDASESADPERQQLFYSRENGVNHPQLVVRFTPGGGSSTSLSSSTNKGKNDFSAAVARAWFERAGRRFCSSARNARKCVTFTSWRPSIP